MPRAQIRSKLLDLIDSDDSDDGLATLGLSVKTTGAVRSVQRAGTTANKSATAMPAAKKGRAAAPAPANRVTKPAAGAARGRRTSDRLAAALEKAEEQQTTRAALADESNDAPERAAKANGAAMGRRAKKGAGRGAENEEKASPPTLATPPASDNSAARTKGRARGRPKKVAEREIPDSTHRLRVAPPAARTAKGRRVGRKAAESEPIVEEETEIPETQQPVPDATDVEMDHLLEDTEQQMDDVPDTPNADAASFPLGSAMRKTAPAIPGSALQPVAQGPSSFEGGGGDVGLRRRLGELSKKYESLELKYRDLRDIAVKEAERNFDRLKKQGEEKTKS